MGAILPESEVFKDNCRHLVQWHGSKFRIVIPKDFFERLDLITNSYQAMAKEKGHAINENRELQANSIREIAIQTKSLAITLGAIFARLSRLDDEHNGREATADGVSFSGDKKPTPPPASSSSSSSCSYWGGSFFSGLKITSTVNWAVSSFTSDSKDTKLYILLCDLFTIKCDEHERKNNGYKEQKIGQIQKHIDESRSCDSCKTVTELKEIDSVTVFDCVSAYLEYIKTPGVFGELKFIVKDVDDLMRGIRRVIEEFTSSIHRTAYYDDKRKQYPMMLLKTWAEELFKVEKQFEVIEQKLKGYDKDLSKEPITYDNFVTVVGDLPLVHYLRQYLNGNSIMSKESLPEYIKAFKTAINNYIGKSVIGAFNLMLRVNNGEDEQLDKVLVRAMALDQLPNIKKNIVEYNKKSMSSTWYINLASYFHKHTDAPYEQVLLNNLTISPIYCYFNQLLNHLQNEKNFSDAFAGFLDNFYSDDCRIENVVEPDQIKIKNQINQLKEIQKKRALSSVESKLLANLNGSHDLNVKVIEKYKKSAIESLFKHEFTENLENRALLLSKLTAEFHTHLLSTSSVINELTSIKFEPANFSQSAWMLENTLLTMFVDFLKGLPKEQKKLFLPYLSTIQQVITERKGEVLHNLQQIEKSNQASCSSSSEQQPSEHTTSSLFLAM